MEAYSGHDRGRVIASVRSLKESIPKLPQWRQDFAESLCAAWARDGSLSEKQYGWVIKLNKLSAEEARESISYPLPMSARKLFRLFMSAGDSGLKNPSMRFEVDGLNVKIREAGDGSRHAGSLLMFAPGGMIGTIGEAGRFMPYRRFEPKDSFITALETVAEFPSELAAEQGRDGGTCCFCGLGLSTEESLSAGYGPICAERWGLPWG